MYNKSNKSLVKFSGLDNNKRHSEPFNIHAEYHRNTQLSIEKFTSYDIINLVELFLGYTSEVNEWSSSPFHDNRPPLE